MANVSANNFAGAIEGILQEYTDECRKGIQMDVKEVAKVCLREIKSASPVRKKGGKRGEYRAGWKIKTTRTNPDYTVCVIYNASNGQLTHLLEHGHVLKSRKGKVIGHSPSIPHIAPAEKNAGRLLEQKIRIEVAGR